MRQPELNVDLAADSDTQFRTMFDQAPIGIAKINALTGQVIEANLRYSELVGVPIEELPHKNWTDYTHPDDHIENQRVLDTLKSGEISHFRLEKRYLHDDGTIIWVDITCAGLMEPDGSCRFYLSMIDNITERKIEQEKLKDAIHLKQMALQSAKAGVVELDVQAEVIRADKVFIERFSLSSVTDLIPYTVFESRIHPDDRQRVRDEYRAQLQSENTMSLQFRVSHPTCDDCYLSIKGDVKKDENGTPLLVTGLYFDITAEKLVEASLKASEEQLRLSTELANVATWEYDVADNVMSRSKNHDTLYGLPHQTIWHIETFTNATHPDDRERSQSIIYASIGAGGHDDYEFDFRAVMPNGKVRWLTVFGQVVKRNSAGEGTLVRGCLIDITARKEAEQRIQKLAHFDQLTGLPNRTMMQDRFQLALHSAKRHNRRMAFLYIDLDDFKAINDSLGHSVGDLVLIETARKLTLALRDEDVVARMGGDEFVVILPDTTVEGAAAVALNLLDRISETLTIQHHQLYVTASIGVAIYPDDGADLESLAKNADIAMYRAKGEGINAYRLFTPEMHETSQRTLTLSQALRTALSNNELAVHYQPLVSDTIFGAEALLRWIHPILGSISPAEFIPIAENNGLIGEIGEWVLQEATAQMKQWLDTGLDLTTIAVNFSAVQFRQHDIVDMVASVLYDVNLPARFLELELTEGVGMDNPEAAIEVMNALTNLGVRLAIDDFGTGYSSLNYLKKFKVSKLKIDQSFVRDLSIDPEDQAIVIAVIDLANAMRIQVIAEGVETIQQVSFLKQQGCHQFQGYYFCRPVEASAFEAFTLEYNTRM